LDSNLVPAAQARTGHQLLSGEHQPDHSPTLSLSLSLFDEHLKLPFLSSLFLFTFWSFYHLRHSLKSQSRSKWQILNAQLFFLFGLVYQRFVLLEATRASHLWPKFFAHHLHQRRLLSISH
jgi:hypothetical protein